MAPTDLVHTLISRLGQSQGDRLVPELRPHFVDVDERDPQDQVLFCARFAKLVNYYREDLQAPQDWSAFLPSLPADPQQARRAIERLLADDTGTQPAHLALLLAFLKLYEFPREAINRFPQRHLNFQLERVLGFTRRPAVPDTAHVLVALKPNTGPLAIRPEHEFSAGKDAAGVDLIYAPTRETVVNRASVASLRSLFLDNRGRGVVLHAPIANSADGLGGELSPEEPRWRAFGHPGLPTAEIGFAVASPVLRMQEGARTVTLSLVLDGWDQPGPSYAVLANSFEAFITGEKGWIGPRPITATPGQAGTVRLVFDVSATEKAVVDYHPALHGYQYPAHDPIVQLLLKPGANTYLDLRGLTVRRASVAVAVTGITAVTLENDFGSLNPKKAFLPFGPEPKEGSRFMVGCEEALSKKLTSLGINVRWHGAPNFAYHYDKYPVVPSDSTFTALVSFRDSGSWNLSDSVNLFELRSTAGDKTFSFQAGTQPTASQTSDEKAVYVLRTAGSVWAMRSAVRWGLQWPRLVAAVVPEPRPGFITFALQHDFLHADYRRASVENALKFSKSTDPNASPIVLKEPYTPTIQGIALSYGARSDDVDIATPTLSAFSNADVQFFHTIGVGQMREHSYQRDQFDFVLRKDVPLLPQLDAKGELLIGLRDLRPGDSVSLLLQVAEGTADPDLPRQDIAWFALCDNYWKRLGSGEIVRDTTNQLLTSGIVQVVVSRQATTVNTILPSGLIWLKAAVPTEVEAVCQLLAVAPNAVEVRFRDAGNDPQRLDVPLEKGKLAKLRFGLSEVKTVTQPFASFGGRPIESEDALVVRGTERMRHKNRCMTAWDFQRVVLDAFPSVHTVKCIPHSKDGLWAAPGHVLLVVVPDLRNRNARDPLQPKVDADTLRNIQTLVDRRSGMQARVVVKNPRYQVVQIDCAVRFREGYEPNYYRAQLNQDLIRFLSPWAFDATRPFAFGGHLYRSAVLNFVEEREYVDYVTDFKLYSAADGSRTQDIEEARPGRPDAILVSAGAHALRDVI